MTLPANGAGNSLAIGLRSVERWLEVTRQLPPSLEEEGQKTEDEGRGRWRKTRMNADKCEKGRMNANECRKRGWARIDAEDVNEAAWKSRIGESCGRVVKWVMRSWVTG